MRARRRIIALVAGAALAAAAAVTFAPNGNAATNAAAVACSGSAWAEGNSYTAGQQVTYQGHLYAALVTHTALVGTGWNPAATPSLWTDQGACSGDTPPATPTTTPATPPTTTPPTNPPTTTPPGGGGNFKSPIYYMAVENDPQDISTAMSASGAKYFNLAFVNDIGGCTPGWGPNLPVSSDTRVAAMVNAVRANGGDVSVSFGGYIANELGASCGSASALANAYQAVVNRYNLTRLDFDWEGDDIDANMSVRMGALKILQDNARGAGRQLHLTLTVPMTTIGFSGLGVDEINQAKANGVTLELVNMMAFDYGLTNAGNMTDSVKLVADAAKNQMKTLFGYDDATAYAHLGLQLMNGHTDQPSELFLQSDFSNLLAYARANHFGWFSYWALNRDRPCDPGLPHNWADGTCSSVTQNAWDFSKIVAQYNG
jgi:hypothetical protein